jgi:hypothetical protein
LDTVDVLLERNESKEKIVHLIKAVHNRYPTLKLMLNRGFEIANITPINALLYESTISGYNFRTKSFSIFTYDFRFVPKKSIERYSIDYWKDDEHEAMVKIYKIALKKGYKPLVTDISLTSLPKVRYECRKNIIEH